MTFCSRIIALFTVLASPSVLPGSPITFSYIQHFDFNIPGIVGHPSAIWTAIFDASLKPSDPFQDAPSSVNQDFVLSGLMTSGRGPELIWGFGGIEGAGPAAFKLGGSNYLGLPFFPLFPVPPCLLPCSATATHPDQTISPIDPTVSFFTSTPDSYVAVAASVPEPSFGFIVALGLTTLALVLKRRALISI
jgi:hypothetical protein